MEWILGILLGRSASLKSVQIPDNESTDNYIHHLWGRMDPATAKHTLHTDPASIIGEEPR